MLINAPICNSQFYPLYTLRLHLGDGLDRDVLIDVLRVLVGRETEGADEGMDPAFSTLWDSFVLTLPKFNIYGIEGVDVSNGDDAEDNNETGGSKDDFTETLQKQTEKSLS